MTKGTMNIMNTINTPRLFTNLFTRARLNNVLRLATLTAACLALPTHALAKFIPYLEGDNSQPIEVDQETADALLLIGATEFAGIDDSAIYYSLLGAEICACKPGNVPGEKLRACVAEDCGGSGTAKCSTQVGVATAYCNWKTISTGTIYVLTEWE